MKLFRIKNVIGRRNQTGAALLIIIIGMVVLATLGIAMYTLTYTANMNQVVAQRAARAFYLSESGIRIAASEYKAAANEKDRMVALHGKTFTMPDNSTVTTEIFPYWFYLPATSSKIIITAPTPAQQIILYLPGGAPPIADTSTTPITSFPPNGLLKYKNGPTVLTYSMVTALPTSLPYGFDAASGGTPVEFTITDTRTSITISPGDEFYLGYYYNLAAGEPVPTAGATLKLADPNNTWKIFPPKNGSIFVVKNESVDQYSYELRDTSTANTVSLTNIQCIGTAPSPFLDISTNSNTPTAIYIGKNIGFRSTSTYGQ